MHDVRQVFQSVLGRWSEAISAVSAVWVRRRVRQCVDFKVKYISIRQSRCRR